MPVDTGIHTTAIGFEYDPVTYAPLYWGNPLALLNMLAAFETVHGYYLSPNGNNEDATLPYGYTPKTLAPQLDCDTSPANCRYDSYGNTYVMIPATSLPLADLILSLADSVGATARQTARRPACARDEGARRPRLRLERGPGRVAAVEPPAVQPVAELGRTSG